MLGYDCFMSGRGRPALSVWVDLSYVAGFLLLSGGQQHTSSPGGKLTFPRTY